MELMESGSKMKRKAKYFMAFNIYKRMEALSVVVPKDKRTFSRHFYRFSRVRSDISEKKLMLDFCLNNLRLIRPDFREQVFSVVSSFYD